MIHLYSSLFAKEIIKIERNFQRAYARMEGRNGYSKQSDFSPLSFCPFFTSLSTRLRFHHSSLVYPLDLALAKFRLATGRRAWRRRDFNWKRVKPRARAHTHDAHGFAARRTFTNAGDAGEEGTRRATRRRLVSINSVSLLTTRRG